MLLDWLDRVIESLDSIQNPPRIVGTTVVRWVRSFSRGPMFSMGPDHIDKPRLLRLYDAYNWNNISMSNQCAHSVKLRYVNITKVIENFTE